jgi:hypothetical protein
MKGDLTPRTLSTRWAGYGWPVRLVRLEYRRLQVPGGVGNTQKDPQRFSSLYEGVVTKLFGRLPDATWVYPGHGGDTTLGAERPHLAEWRARGW